jgi:hypothetical protein
MPPAAPVTIATLFVERSWLSSFWWPPEIGG